MGYFYALLFVDIRDNKEKYNVVDGWVATNMFRSFVRKTYPSFGFLGYCHKSDAELDDELAEIKKQYIDGAVLIIDDMTTFSRIDIEIKNKYVFIFNNSEFRIYNVCDLIQGGIPYYYGRDFILNAVNNGNLNLSTLPNIGDDKALQVLIEQWAKDVGYKLFYRIAGQGVTDSPYYVALLEFLYGAGYALVGSELGCVASPKEGEDKVLQLVVEKWARRYGYMFNDWCSDISYESAYTTLANRLNRAGYRLVRDDGMVSIRGDARWKYWANQAPVSEYLEANFEVRYLLDTPRDKINYFKQMEALKIWFKEECSDIYGVFA